MIQKIKIKDTGKYGKGVFAKENIKRGEIVHILKGEIFDIKDFADRVNSGKEYIDDPFQIGRRTYIDLDELSRTFNHSCNPNGGIRKNSELFALRDIKKGEEITYDYSLTISPTIWEMECKCGARNCRKKLGDVLSVPKTQLKQYKEVGALQTYMRLLLREIDDGSYKIPKYELATLEKLKNTN